MKTSLHVITRLDMGGSAQNTLKTCIGLSGGKYRVVLICGTTREFNMPEDERRAVAENLDSAVKHKNCINLQKTLKKIAPACKMLLWNASSPIEPIKPI